MNNEPVAWIIQDKYGRPALSWKGNPISYSAISVEQEDIPLYTHPVKTLTDEEIEEAEKSCKKPLASWEWQVEFARAILRKAQEK